MRKQKNVVFLLKKRLKKIIARGKEKGTIIFIHGNSSSNKVFETVLNSDQIQQTMIALDLPGHGESVKKL